MYPPQQPSGGQQYGAPAPTQASPQQIEAYKQMYYTVIREKNLQSFYPLGDRRLDLYASRASAQVDQLCARWRIPPEIGRDVARLALFDIIIFIGESSLVFISDTSDSRKDDSGSMAFEEDGKRIEDLKAVLSRLLFAVMLFDDDGISVRCMNTSPSVRLDNIKSEQEVEMLVSNIPFSGTTPLGTELGEKVLEPMVIAKAFANNLQKPVMIITITDGQPTAERKGDRALHDAVRSASSKLAGTRYGAGAASFQFAQVGNDGAATRFLQKLDKDPQIGHLIDCTSSKSIDSMHE